MPKTTTTKGNVMDVTNVSVLQLLGGLLFLAVAWELWGVASSPINWTGGLIGSALFATVFYAVAVLSSLAVFFGSLKGMGGWMVKKRAMMAGFTLALLTASNGTLFLATLIGFLAVFFGSKHGPMMGNMAGCQCMECNCAK